MCEHEPTPGESACVDDECTGRRIQIPECEEERCSQNDANKIFERTETE